MKLFNFINLLALLFSVSAIADSPEIRTKDLVGTWRFYKKVFRDQDMPEPPDGVLRLFFIFYDDGTNRLFWTHEGQDEWCERTGEYSVDQNILRDKVTWVNPHNSNICASDPDMQLDREAFTPISFAPNGDFELNLFLDADPLKIVWKKLGD